MALVEHRNWGGVLVRRLGRLRANGQWRRAQGEQPVIAQVLPGRFASVLVFFAGVLEDFAPQFVEDLGQRVSSQKASARQRVTQLAQQFGQFGEADLPLVLLPTERVGVPMPDKQQEGT